jgi:uncharacterized protein YcfJ
MKNAIIGLGALALMSSAAYAHEPQIEDAYKTITKNIPHTQQVCETSQVPIYGQGEFDQEGAIVGGIIGGVIGNQIGKGGGKSGATGVGAIIGSVMGGKGEKKIIGYQNVQQCYDKVSYTTETKEVYSHSVIAFEYEGRLYRVKFDRN